MSSGSHRRRRLFYTQLMRTGCGAIAECRYGILATTTDFRSWVELHWRSFSYHRGIPMSLFAMFSCKYQTSQIIIRLIGDKIPYSPDCYWNIICYFSRERWEYRILLSMMHWLLIPTDRFKLLTRITNVLIRICQVYRKASGTSFVEISPIKFHITDIWNFA